jgi:predicted metal-binding membrane protein
MSAILRLNTDRRRSYATAASLVLSAWLALAIWSLSPYAEWLDHARIEEIAAPPTVRLAVFTLGWTLMVIAMMLPSTLLLLDRCLGNKPMSARRIAPAILAYLAVWTVFGTLSYLGDGVLHEIVERLPALEGVIAPAVLLLAGIYQFTPIKRACLSRCRPEGAVFTAFGPTSSHHDWIVGLRHGVFCLGSGWALMLLMFAIGGVSLLWMLVLGVMMTAERLTDPGVYLARVVGVLLIVSSVVFLF